MNRMMLLVILAGIAALVLFAKPQPQEVVQNAPQETAAVVLLEAPTNSAPAPTPAPTLTEVQIEGTPPPVAGTDLKVIAMYPPGDETPKNEIILYFNENLASFESSSGNMDQVLITEPPVTGVTTFRDNYLRFIAGDITSVFDNPLITQLNITIHENLRSVSGQALAPDMRHFSFVAPSPVIEDIRVEKITSENAFVQLTFSRFVKLDALQDHISVSDSAGNPVNVTSSAHQNGYQAMLQVPLNALLPINIEIAEGLPWGTGFEWTAGKMTSPYPTVKVLELNSALINTDDTPYIELTFSDIITFDWLQYLLKVTTKGSTEPIAFAVQYGNSLPKNTALLVLANTEEMKALEEAEITISPWLCNANGTRHISNTVVKASKTLQKSEDTERRGPFELYYHYWNTNITDGPVLQLNFSQPINPEELQSHIEFVPPVAAVVEMGSRWSRNLQVKGDFKSETNYTMRISSGLKSQKGKPLLAQDSSYALEETPLQKGAAFDMTDRYYFPKRDMANPVVKARNITEAEVQVAQVFPSNLPVFVRDFNQGGASPHLLNQYAKEIGKASVTFPKVPDTLQTNTVDLKALLASGQRGVFIMNVEPSYDYNDNSRLVIYTDLGALTQWTKDGLVIFVHNLFTLAPATQAKVTVYSDKFQPIGSTYTNTDGIARFMSFEAAFGVPALAIIEAEDDYTFVDLRSAEETKTPFTASMPNYDQDGYDAYIYLDRNLYRPGETVQIRWIVRTHYVDAIAGVPFQLRIANPKGRYIYEAPVTPSEFGTGTFSFKTEQTHPTGKYRVELRVPEAPMPTGETSFNLEEFVPNRMKAETSFDCEKLVAGQTTAIEIKAENLYGGPAAARNTEARIYLRPKKFESSAWPDYHFGNEDVLEDKLIKLGQAVTDENGVARFNYTFTPPSDATMPLEAVLGAQVFEVGGRSVSAMDSAIAIPFDILLGIAAAARDDAEKLEVHVAAVRSDETAADLANVQITVEREEWNYHIRGFYHNRETRWEKEFVTVRTMDVPLTAGKGSVELDYPDYGRYRIRVHSPATRMYSMLLFDRWWGKLNIVSSSRPELVNLSVDKEIYHAGDQLNLRIECPYDGNAFVVVQGEQIMDQMVVPVKGGEGRATLVVPHDWFPNAWIQATVVRSAEKPEGAQYPYSSFGMVNVPLDAPERRIEVAMLNVPEEIRPATTYTLNLATKDGSGAPVKAEVTVAAVDEGIHSILGYENPDPYKWFQRSRQFNLLRAYYYDNVFFDGTPSAIGGDMMRRLGIASQVGENWIRPVALWSGAVTTDESGQAAITFEVPEFTGQLRLVAVAVNATATGASAASMYVRRPYILRTGMPRFALPGDNFECTGSVINTTDAPVTARLRWTASGTLSGTGEKQLELAANGEASWRAPIVAGAVPGQGRIEWTAVFLNSAGETLETLAEDAPIPVNSPAAYQTDTQLITLAPGETRVIENTQFVNEPALHTAVHVAGTPIWRLYPGLRYLLQYPHGCVEQVTSQALPLYLLRNYAQVYQGLLSKDQTVDAGVVDTYIRYAIERLLLMQTSDGGLSTWPGGISSYPYGSVYALHFLTLMRRDRTYEVYDAAFKSLQRYVAEVMRDERHYSKYPYDYYLRAYACYVLALDGNLEAIEYIPRFDHVGIPSSARYLLAAAKAMNSQDPGDLEAYIINSPVAEFDSDQYSGTLHSSIRAEAINLIALIQMKADPEKMQSLVASLFDYFDTHRYYSTQESAFAVTALGMYIEHFHKDNPEAIGAKIIAPDGDHILSGNQLYENVFPGVSPRYEISNTGTIPIYINVEMGGLPLQPRTVVVEEGVSIKRQYFREGGGTIEDNTFGQGEQCVVALTIRPKRDLENLMLVDMLPAGLEVANPRLEPEIQPNAEQQENNDADGNENENNSETNNENPILTPAHLEVRDDRIAFAVDRLMANKTYTFRYLVRAVTPGTFQAPALHAECMYKPSICATTLPGEITVK